MRPARRWPLGRSLRARLSLALGGVSLVVLVVAVAAVDSVFGTIQRRQLEGVVQSEAERVASLVRSGTLGERLLSGDAALRLQFVGDDDRVRLPDPGESPLPFARSPSRVMAEGVPYLVTSLPWTLPSGAVIGSVRVGLDLRETDASRARLRVSLASVGVAAGLASVALALVVLRRSLAPLQDFAAEAAALDPVAPRLTPYRGTDDEIRALSDALERALATIRARQRAERDALAEIAHELAGPLTVVAAELRALGQHQPGDERVAAARAAASELVHASRDLRTLARGELERSVELEVLDVGPLARAVAREYPGLPVHVETGDRRVVAEPERLRQVVRNLLRNAVQACGEAARVRLTVHSDGDEVHVEVVDDGPGLSPADAGRVFERYVSGRAGGSGIGLAVVRRVVEAYGGRVGVRSSRDGTVFSVALPAFRTQLVAEDEAPGRGDG